MSKRQRVPGPFFRNLPGTIRTSLPRLVLVISAACALLVIGGSSYVISRATPKPVKDLPKSTKHVSTPPPASQAEVLGETTSPAATPTAAEPSSATTSAPSSAAPSASSATSSSATASTSPPATVNVSTNPKKTEVHVDTPVGSLLLDLPLGI